MIKLINGGVYYTEGRIVKEKDAFMVEKKKQAAIAGTISNSILGGHSRGNGLKFDALMTDKSTCGGVVEAAAAAGIDNYSIPLISDKKECGGTFVPGEISSLHAYVCENEVKCGDMILATSHNCRFGALGAMAVEGSGGELVKQLSNKAYDVAKPAVVAVYMRGKPAKGVGAYDVALALLDAVAKKDFLKDKVLEFVGPGIKNLSMDFRIGIDAMSARTNCLSTVWETDEACGEYYKTHLREGDFKALKPADPAYYDGAVIIDLSRVDPMICLSFEPLSILTVKQFIQNAGENVVCDGGVIGGCTGGSYESFAEVAEILKNGNFGKFSLCAYPNSQTVFKSLAENGYIPALLGAGVAIKPVCGKVHGGRLTLSTGMKVSADARTVAATAANGGVLTPATEVEYVKKIKKYSYDKNIYEKKVLRGGCPVAGEAVMLPPLAQNVLLKWGSDGTPDLKFDIKPDTVCAGFVAGKAEDTPCEQRERGVLANVACAYTSRRYVSELAEFGILPLICRKFDFCEGDYIYLENLCELLKSGCTALPAKHFSGGKVKNIMLEIQVNEEQRNIILCGGLINYCKNK